MNTTAFISPTMHWLYEKHPDWASDTETLYKLGFSKKTMRDVHGFDVFGFDELGVDRLGCNEASYRDPFIAAVGASCGDYLSLSNKLAVGLPKFLRLKPVLEDLCRERWDIEDDWLPTSVGPKDGKKRFFRQLSPEFAIGIHWFDLDDRRDNYFMLRTDVIAKLASDDTERDLPFRVISYVRGPEHGTLHEDVFCVRHISEARAAIVGHMDEYLQPLHDWQVRIVDSADGPALAAFSRAELEDTHGDDFGGLVTALTKEDALQSVMDNARTSTVKDMAMRGIMEMTGQPVVMKGPRM